MYGLLKQSIIRHYWWCCSSGDFWLTLQVTGSLVQFQSWFVAVVTCWKLNGQCVLSLYYHRSFFLSLVLNAWHSHKLFLCGDKCNNHKQPSGILFAGFFQDKSVIICGSDHRTVAKFGVLYLSIIYSSSFQCCQMPAKATMVSGAFSFLQLISARIIGWRLSILIVPVLSKALSRQNIAVSIKMDPNRISRS